MKVLPALAAALALLLWSPVASAQRDGCSLESPQPTGMRTLAWDHGPMTFQFSSSDPAAPETIVRGSFRLVDAALVVERLGTASQALARLEVRHVAVIEFRDVDRDGRYGFQDQDVQRIVLAGLPGATLETLPLDLARPSEGFEATARFPLNARTGLDELVPGRLELKLIVVAGARPVGGRAVDPDRVSMELGIDRFPFAANDTRLAVDVRQGTPQDLWGGSDGIRVGASDTPHLSYLWADCVHVQDEATPMGVTILEYGRERGGDEIATVFSYPTGDLVAHQSSAGLSAAIPSAPDPDPTGTLHFGDWRIFVPAAATSGLVVGLSIWRRLRPGG